MLNIFPQKQIVAKLTNSKKTAYLCQKIKSILMLYFFTPSIVSRNIKHLINSSNLSKQVMWLNLKYKSFKYNIPTVFILILHRELTGFFSSRVTNRILIMSSNRCVFENTLSCVAAIRIRHLHISNLIWIVNNELIKNIF